MSTHATGSPEAAIWLEKYRHSEVEVIYASPNGFKDSGLLSDFCDQWIELQKGGVNGETFLIPVPAIRLVKIVRHAAAPETTLLRPATLEVGEEEEATNAAKGR